MLAHHPAAHSPFTRAPELSPVHRDEPNSARERHLQLRHQRLVRHHRTRSSSCLTTALRLASKDRHRPVG